MEDTLRVLQACRVRVRLGVLILVLMEDTLREVYNSWNCRLSRLNPCFNGRYSQRFQRGKQCNTCTSVLILVLMEDTLREKIKL